MFSTRISLRSLQGSSIHIWVPTQNRHEMSAMRTIVSPHLLQTRKVSAMYPQHHSCQFFDHLIYFYKVPSFYGPFYKFPKSQVKMLIIKPLTHQSPEVQRLNCRIQSRNSSQPMHEASGSRRHTKGGYY